MIYSNIFDEIKRRNDLLDKCIKDPELLLAEHKLCKHDIFHFIDNWIWTFDPRHAPPHLPFKLYDYQSETIKWLEERFKKKEVGLIEKSRDMGATWLLVVWCVHKWLFTSGFTCLFGSKTESDVDDTSLSSIFGKIRYALNRLPKFLCPDLTAKVNEKRHADSYLSIINPSNGSEIVGDSANSNFGRSGRASIVFLDEYAFVENSDKIWSAVCEVSDVIVPVSTANGKGNMFYDLRSRGSIPVLSLHWSRHPDKDKAWYEGRKKTMEPHQIAQELDIDYSSSKSGRVYKRFDKQYHVAKNIIYPNLAFEQFVTMDFGIADPTALIFGQIDPEGSIDIYASYDTTDQDIEFFIPMFGGARPAKELWMLLPKYEQERIDNFLKKVFINKESRQFNKLDFTYYGDFAGTQRSANNRRSIRERLKNEGNINLKVSSQQDFATRIQSFDNLLKLRENKRTAVVQSRLLISPDCERVTDAIMNYVWDKDDINNPNLKPRHDWSSHYVSALEFFAINRFPIRDQGKTSMERIR